MKIEKLSPNKIKVTLSFEDMNQWELNFDNLTYNSPQIQELFWNVMKQAEDELGFYAENAQLMVEAMPSKSEGGVIMIVSKVDEEQQALARHVRARLKRTEIKVRKKNKNLIQPQIYEFEQFDDVVSGCRRIYEFFEGYSVLYRYEDRYYISLYNLNDMDEKINHIILEYGEKKPSTAIFEGRLVEYGEVLIMQNAVEALYTFFE